MKKMSLDMTVHDLCEEFPEAINIMANLGFPEIVEKDRRDTVGRMMTPAKGAMVKDVPIETMVAAFQEAGFVVEGFENGTENSNDLSSSNNSSDSETGTENAADIDAHRVDVIKNLLNKLQTGASVDEVKADFAREFDGVAATEVSKAEQALMAEGVPVNDVQRLCDVHAAALGEHVEAAEGTPEVVDIPGHPVHSLLAENAALTAYLNNTLKPAIESVRSGAADAASLVEGLRTIRQVSVHYRRKENLMFPLLEKHDITGPSKVMWGKDDEVRDAIDQATELASTDNADKAAVATAADAAVEGVEGMIYKEENILIPMMAEQFDTMEWMAVAEDEPDIGFVFIDTPQKWVPSMNDLLAATAKHEAQRAAGEVEEKPEVSADYIKLPTGSFNAQELAAVLNTLPLEITFVDKDDIVRYFSHGDNRTFARPIASLGNNVMTCHPPKNQEMVKNIFDSFKDGSEDHYDFWMHMGPKFVYVRYFAVRNRAGEYLGALEVTQDIAPIQALEGENRRGENQPD
ncbi:DUF438 domain-containing protein [Cryptobacterium curtum]